MGFRNFEFFFESNDFVRILRNTVLYGIDFLVLDNIIALIISIMLYNVTKRSALKFYQTTLIFPNFISMVLVAFIVYSILSPTSGVLNQVLEAFGKTPIDWYSKPQHWPFILTFVQVWKTVGMQSIVFYAALMGIDETLFEAARIDGATKWGEIRFIIIPEMASIVSIYLILGVGTLINGDFGLFYQTPMNIGLLYPTTDVISTYVFRALQTNPNMGSTAAVGLFQSVIGTILVVIANLAVKKINPENSLF